MTTTYRFKRTTLFIILYFFMLGATGGCMYYTIYHGFLAGKENDLVASAFGALVLIMMVTTSGLLFYKVADEISVWTYPENNDSVEKLMIGQDE